MPKDQEPEVPSVLSCVRKALRELTEFCSWCKKGSEVREDGSHIDKTTGVVTDKCAILSYQKVVKEIREALKRV